MSWLKSYLKEQMVSNKGVVPEVKFLQPENIFFMNSPAGLLKYKPKTVKEMTHFRDNYVNLFEHYRQFSPDKFFDLYAVIRKEVKGVKYTANLHTRAKGVLCNLNPF